MKKIVILIVAVLAVAAGFYLWKQHAQKQTQGSAVAAGAKSAVEVGIVTIAPKAINFTKDLPGRTSSFRIAEIRPQVNGIITKRLYQEGSDVTEGQQLYQIDPATYLAAYNSSQADLMKAQASLKAAQSTYARNEELVKVGAVSKQGFEDFRATLDQAKADVAIAKAALATAKINLDYTKVFSPISGRIGKSFVTEGALVTANQTTALATVQQFDPIYVDVTQSSVELMDLRRQLDSAEKTPVTLLLEGDTKVYDQTGQLQFSDVTVDQTTGSVQLRVLFPNPKHELLPGLFVRARIEQARNDAAILVPQKSVSRTASGSVTVWLVGEGDKVSVHPIIVSQAVDDQWLVTDGLKAGDRVVVEGLQKVAPDVVVTPVETAEESASMPETQQEEPSAAVSAIDTSKEPATDQGTVKDDASLPQGDTSEKTQAE